MLLLSASIWEISCWGIVAIGSVYLTLLVLGLKRQPILSAQTSIALPRSIPRVTVLVTARNEEACVAKCLLSLAKQDYPNFEIIAIDDRSTDATGAIMDRLEMEFPDFLSVLHIDSLPSGWTGKTHALHVGSQSATGEWLIDMDANCEVQSSSAISLAVQEAQRRDVDMLSLTPQFVLHTAWERIAVPVCSALMLDWFQPARVNNPKLSTSYAYGSFLMMSRYCYDSLGGWSRFRGQFSEEIAIAKAAKASDLKLVVLRNDGIYQTFLHNSIRDSWNNWTGILCGALSREALVLSLTRLVVGSLIPTAGLLIYIAISCSGGTLPSHWNGIAVAAAAAVVLQQIYSAFTFRRIGGYGLWWLAAPMGHLALAGMLTRALIIRSANHSTQRDDTVLPYDQSITMPRTTPPTLSIRATQAR